ncbi:TPA: LacI family DNA-binding transcriptional regulator [Vibrio alginolyticus]|nr:MULTISPECIES: substrate-binding domain-containing protein [Vibrio]EGQ7760959.1 LacI family transcriptional regulator [Vibrio alginolyticus]EGQ8052995.1 LacI family transcriptional regulator [Vibrio alginolyticus]EIP0121127.1 substrate-binding domain-containing protein [Vibrio alginolyticus]EJL6745502.1 substrate-binding domain-containing protein [Vibrio alginolyticus]EJN8559290.1 substrate-binding domain-containing protein [Vibrio alginolyticus]
MKNRKSMMERNRKANSKDVAKLAGVSQASVSRAFTPGSQISKANKEKILEAAKQLNYVPNAMARALISSHSNCIAIVQPVSKNPYFYAKVLQKLLELLQAENQRVVLFSQDDKNVDDILPLIDQYQVDGVIMASATVDAKLINQYANRGIEFSFINRSVPNVYASSVCTDNYQSTKDLITYLDSKGHKRFACIAGNKNASTTISRVEGYLSRIEELELENIGVLYDDFSVDSGYHSLLSLLENSDKRPDVVMCGNDEVAIGVINAIKEHTELNIPDDIAVTGFDDIEAAKWFPYSLTTIEQPINQLCEVTVSDLLERIRSPDKQPINMSIKGALIKRKSA